MTRQNEKKSGDWLSWVLIIFMLNVFWPVGLFLLLAKLFGNDDRTRQKTPPRAAARQSGSAAQAAAVPRSAAAPQNAAADAGRTGRATQAARQVVRTPDTKKSNAVWLKLAGVILLAYGLYMGADPASMVLSGYVANWIGELLRYAALAAAGGGMLLSGFSMDRTMRRYARCAAVIGQRNAMPLPELAEKLGISEKQTARDLSRMIERNYFGPMAYINAGKNCFFRSGESDAADSAARQSGSAPKEQPQQAEEGYSGILRNIRRANDRIADPELSAKIERLEEITGRIFRAVEEDPRKRSRIDTLLSYYLPTTQKLLDTYAEFESTGVEGENLRTAKERIRSTMDSIVAGFEHQLDELYRTDAMDVDSDIRVMETMLNRDTASVEKDFGLGRTAKTPSAGENAGGTAVQREP